MLNVIYAHLHYLIGAGALVLIVACALFAVHVRQQRKLRGEGQRAVERLQKLKFGNPPESSKVGARVQDMIETKNIQTQELSAQLDSPPQVAAEVPAVAELESPAAVPQEPTVLQETVEPHEATVLQETSVLQKTSVPQEAVEPREARVLQETAEPQESTVLQKTVAPRQATALQEAVEPQEATVLQETSVLQKTSAPQEAVDPQQARVLQETAEPEEVPQPQETGNSILETSKHRESVGLDTTVLSETPATAKIGVREMAAWEESSQAEADLALKIGTKVLAIRNIGSVKEGEFGIITGTTGASRFGLSRPKYTCTFANNIKCQARPDQIETCDHPYGLQELEQPDFASIVSRQLTSRMQHLLAR